MARRAHILLTLCLAWGVGSGTIGAAPRAGQAETSVRDISGKTRRVPEPGKKATVLFFVAHDCPVSNGYAPEMNRICAKYGPLGVAFYIVYAEADYPAASAQKH